MHRTSTQVHLCTAGDVGGQALLHARPKAASRGSDFQSQRRGTPVLALLINRTRAQASPLASGVRCWAQGHKWLAPKHIQLLLTHARCLWGRHTYPPTATSTPTGGWGIVRSASEGWTSASKVATAQQRGSLWPWSGPAVSSLLSSEPCWGRVCTGTFVVSRPCPDDHDAEPPAWVCQQ